MLQFLQWGVFQSSRVVARCTEARRRAVRALWRLRRAMRTRFVETSPGSSGLRRVGLRHRDRHSCSLQQQVALLVRFEKRRCRLEHGQKNTAATHPPLSPGRGTQFGSRASGSSSERRKTVRSGTRPKKYRRQTSDVEGCTWLAFSQAPLRLTLRAQSCRSCRPRGHPVTESPPPAHSGAASTLASNPRPTQGRGLDLETVRWRGACRRPCTWPAPVTYLSVTRPTTSAPESAQPARPTSGRSQSGEVPAVRPPGPPRSMALELWSHLCLRTPGSAGLGWLEPPPQWRGVCHCVHIHYGSVPFCGTLAAVPNTSFCGNRLHCFRFRLCRLENAQKSTAANCMHAAVMSEATTKSTPCSAR